MPSCDLGERIGVGAGDRPGRRAEAVIVSAVLEVFREGDQAGSARGGLVGESDGRRDVARYVLAGIELDEGDLEMHGRIVRPRRERPAVATPGRAVMTPGADRSSSLPDGRANWPWR